MEKEVKRKGKGKGRRGWGGADAGCLHCSVAWLVTYLIYSVFSLSLSLFPLLLSLFFDILLVIEAISDVRLVCICSECANFFLSLFLYV